jgi:hypothetical protein
LTGAGAVLAAPDVVAFELVAPELAAPLAGADGEAGVDPRGRDSMAFESIVPLRTGAD